MTAPCFVLRLLAPQGSGPWLDAQLQEQGVTAWQELSLPEKEGRAVYGQARPPLQQLAEALRERFGRAMPGQQLEHDVEALSGDWELAWLQHLEPVEFGSGLRLQVGEAPEPRDPNTLYLQPALAFGYGEHPTTRLILNWLAEQGPRLDEDMLDVGCGTGVLGLAGLRLGISRVVGVDVDEGSVAVARANAELNQLGHRASFRGCGLEKVDGQFGLVCANIELNTLLQLAPTMLQRLRSSGRIVLSGILSGQSLELIARLDGLGARAAVAGELDGWHLVVGEGAPPFS